MEKGNILSDLIQERTILEAQKSDYYRIASIHSWEEFTDGTNGYRGITNHHF